MENEKGKGRREKEVTEERKQEEKRKRESLNNMPASNMLTLKSCFTWLNS